MHHTRASMESLNSQLHVAFDAISSTAAKIEQVTHEDLYPQLMQLLKRYSENVQECDNLIDTKEKL